MSSESNNSLFFHCLERYEKQSLEITNRNELVEFFCRNVIPTLAENEIISSLRDKWQIHRNELNDQVQKKEKKALEETIDTFRKIKAVVGDSGNESIKQKMTFIEAIIQGNEKIYGPPLYLILYDELKFLLHLLLEYGYKDLCKNYAKLATHKKYIQKDLNQEERWVLVLDEGRTSKILNDKELETARREDRSLLAVPPDYELVEETYIEEFFFAPTVIDAYAAMDAIHWDQLREPAVVWWYFESALWCWQTPKFYFDQVISPKNGKDQDKHFQTICEKSAWQEIAIVKESPETQLTPVIFTKDFFQVGLTTLINEISAYLSRSKDISSKSIQPSQQSITLFELQLDGNELWVLVTFENKAKEKFYVQKFQEGWNSEGSQLFKFVNNIFKDPQAGEKKAKLEWPWESASKHINRIRLPKILKQAFFEKSSKALFRFKGTQIKLKSSENETINLILKELRENHLKSEKPSFDRATNLDNSFSKDR